MASKIVPLLPEHKVYVEPFCGSAAVFFKKGRPEVSNQDHYREVLNDKDGRIVNFFRVLRDVEQSKELIRLLELTPYSKEEYYWAKGYDGDDPIEKARAWFVGINQSFGGKPFNGWGRSKAARHHAVSYAIKTKHLGPICSRLQGVYIEQDDALQILSRWDSTNTCFYLDPPYPGTDQGSYKGYTQGDFEALCAAAAKVKGSVVLSCYDNPAANALGWERHEFRAHSSAARDKGRGPRTEVVWVKDANK